MDQMAVFKLGRVALNQNADPLAASMTTMGHESHPSLGGLVLLVFEAVMEVVCVSLPGYILARQGLFKPEHQKFVANLNMQLFTPCLIFSKLAKQLKPSELGSLAVIPIIFIAQTCVSYIVSIGVSKVFRFSKRPSNFVTAMGVFGNSNSLPISLVISLSQTLKSLRWDRKPDDTASAVASRGILYLLIFQQLGQLLRWSWGFHVLLAKKDHYEEYQDETVEGGLYRDNSISRETLIPGLDGESPDNDAAKIDGSDDSDIYEPAGRTPEVGTASTSPIESEDEGGAPGQHLRKNVTAPDNLGDFGTRTGVPNDIMSFPPMPERESFEPPKGPKGYFARAKLSVVKVAKSTGQRTSRVTKKVYSRIPRPIRVAMEKTYGFLCEFMNPPLWAMLISVVVASVPQLRALFFEDTFVRNSVTRAVSQSAGVAVPLILVVLGANLANSTKESDTADSEEARIGTRLLVASLISRMLLPMLIMMPVLALFAKFVPVSILDDPIFIIVCFLLTGAPSALQLAQICQINEVYEGVMSKILFQSYVVWYVVTPCPPYLVPLY
ncbi:auxin efflux carrier [Xylariaceae sp. FL0804]|nr:auxin efflux carrier [Xylariaceae sp. FL0804]